MVWVVPYSFSGVGISCLDVDEAAFGKAFNIQTVAIFNVPEPSNTCKALREMFLDFKAAGEFGIVLSRGNGGGEDDTYIHKAFNCAMWADGVARYGQYMLLLLLHCSY